MRRVVRELNDAFEAVHLSSQKIIMENNYALLIRQSDLFGASVCELVVRSAAKVEQCFGGITTRLWDDPFEWTLPESFTEKQSVLEYLDEVAAVRGRAFALFKSDYDLKREIPAPEKLSTLFSVVTKSRVDSTKFLRMAEVTLISVRSK